MYVCVYIYIYMYMYIYIYIYIYIYSHQPISNLLPWAVTFIPMPMPKPACRASLNNKWVQYEVGRTFWAGVWAQRQDNRLVTWLWRGMAQPHSAKAVGEPDNTNAQSRTQSEGRTSMCF